MLERPAAATSGRAFQLGEARCERLVDGVMSALKSGPGAA